MLIKKLIKYIKLGEGQSVSMRKRLILYMMLLFIIVVSLLVAALVFSGVITMDDERIYDAMSMRLDTEDQTIRDEVDLLTVQGISLAENIGRETEHILDDNNVSPTKMSNNLDILSKLQNSYYGYMNTAVQVSDASGVYAIINATANTKVENSEDSRSGVYLRVSNIDLKEKANKELNLYRGIAEIGREKGLRMNNQWMLEFDMTRTELKIPSGRVNNLSSNYYYTSKTKLVNMWEEVVLLSVPFVGKDGTVYGVCGLELSEALFTLWHPAFKSDYGPFVTVVAPYDGNRLRLDEGLLGGAKDTFLTDKESFEVSDAGKFIRLSGSYGDYIGIMEETDIFGKYVSDADSSKWMICILTPQSYYNDYIRSIRIRWLLILFGVNILSIILITIFSRRYVNPVLSGMEALMGDGETGKTGYSEIDDLIEFMKSRSEDEKIIEEKLPENVAILFDKFVENSKKLSPAEWIVMDLYIDGCEIADIPDKAFISMATVRKHNRSIYEKLEVSSRDELMLYIDLFRRSDRLDDLKQ
ncbi:MAG: helix-turn-helix transcriptional regulator [Lachnospiraceae bacterium]|nr:helix-turn-helix transcriptional regulator [Lachnospiraceae bacterium]